MIVDVLPNQYERIASKHTFKPWQAGLLGDMISSKRDRNELIGLHMGRGAGHTYFTRVAASIEFPARTKIYVTRHSQLSEFSSLLFDDGKVHEPIDMLDREDFSGYAGNPVDFVVIDLNDEHARRFKDAIQSIRMTIPLSARIVLLQPNFLNFLDTALICNV